MTVCKSDLDPIDIQFDGKRNVRPEGKIAVSSYHKYFRYLFKIFNDSEIRDIPKMEDNIYIFTSKDLNYPGVQFIGFTINVRV